ncbi:hypothetical protein BCR36DRAFT_408765 [Piromyces finnis]|uniref:Uncharacterized protein n=1 Tax=Piromyces finnis TaxID=1754191 RepID=A0A1Y1VLC1_9FUNG|nr:hypothetical protein BCR36DRAFT_408765 [Piromyces finnis]|eukprot:ORX59261.1 hypothetical protein BCR36DRAFT_408765 [Piromyces finnis]
MKEKEELLYILTKDSYFPKFDKKVKLLELGIENFNKKRSEFAETIPVKLEEVGENAINTVIYEKYIDDKNKKFNEWLNANKKDLEKDYENEIKNKFIESRENEFEEFKIECKNNGITELKKIKNAFYKKYMDDLKEYAENLKKYAKDFASTKYDNLFFNDFKIKYENDKYDDLLIVANEARENEINKEYISSMNDEELEKLYSIYSNEETSKRINNRLKYVYVLCNDFTLRYRDLCNNLNFYSKNDKDSKNLRNISRGRNIDNFYEKKELIEVLIYSVCFYNLKNELSSIQNYKEISVSNITNLLENNTADETIIDLIEYILNVVTNNNINEYCCKRPYQTFLLYTLLSSISNLIKTTRYNIIDVWKKYLFTYNLIVIL